MSKDWSNLAKVVYRRTYARPMADGSLENWGDTIERVIQGNVRGHNVSEQEVERLRYFMLNRKAIPAGRGLWYSGSDGHSRIGGVALNNCWGLTADDWTHFVLAQDLLMLGGGVGLSVEHRFVSKLPKIRKGVNIVHHFAKDADFIVPDSREGWCELTRRVLEAFFVTGRSFSYSTVCVRSSGESIKGFGGTASGPKPLVAFVSKLVTLLTSRQGKAVRPLDAADIICSIGEMVVAGNVRRSAIIILGDAFDKDYLRAKRWDLGDIPTQRAMANFSIVCDDIDDVHPLFWKTYEQGEPFGIVNRTNIQAFARMGERKKDSAVVVNPCVPAGTEILTDKGYLAIDTLVGTTVNVWNGLSFSPVQPQVTGTNQPLVTITLSSGQTLTCTPSHQFVVQDNYRSDPYLKPAGEMVSGTKLAKFSLPVLRTGEEVLDAIAYTQGVKSGDGMDDYNYMMLYGEKRELASRMSGHLGEVIKDGKRSNFRFFGLPSLPKTFVPFNWNLEAKLAWLAGLLDTDGTELIEGGSQIASVEPHFLLSLQKMLTTMGCPSKVTTVTRPAGFRDMPDGHGGTKGYFCQKIYRILIGAVQVQDLKRLGLHCTRLKFDKKPQRDASRFVTVTSVVPAGTAEKVYCFREGQVGLGCFEGVVTGQCAEATLENGEPCNLQEVALPNLSGEDEFIEAARLMHRYGKRVTLERYHHAVVQEVIDRNRRIGTGITGCLEAPDLFNPRVLDRAYAAIQEENISYSAELGIPESIRTTVIKPSGTVSKILDVSGEGLHPGFSRYMVQRVRFSAADALIPKLRAAGHHMEPVVRFDGSFDHNTLVVDFYIHTPAHLPCADENWSTWRQLDTLLLAQKHWADQSVSVTVYYRREEIEELKGWLSNNLKYLKTISFLCHNEHGFKQAPKEAISKESYEKLSSRIKPIDSDEISAGDLESLECEGGACPIR